MDRFLLFFVLGLLLIATTTTKAQHPIDVKLEDCLEENYSTGGMVECTTEAYESWGDELDKYYRALKEVMNEKGQETLKDAQRAWERFRDKEFEMVEDMYSTVTERTGGGTMYKLVIINQKMQTVKKRTLELKEYYNFVTSQGR